jgi:hypothetical protein
MTVRIKVVPNNRPNDDGRWIETDRDLPKRFALSLCYDETVASLAGVLPADHHVVAIERST